MTTKPLPLTADALDISLAGSLLFENITMLSYGFRDCVKHKKEIPFKITNNNTRLSLANMADELMYLIISQNKLCYNANSKIVASKAADNGGK